ADPALGGAHGPGQGPGHRGVGHAGRQHGQEGGGLLVQRARRDRDRGGPGPLGLEQGDEGVQDGGAVDDEGGVDGAGGDRGRDQRQLVVGDEQLDGQLGPGPGLLAGGGAGQDVVVHPAGDGQGGGVVDDPVDDADGEPAALQRVAGAGLVR